MRIRINRLLTSHGRGGLEGARPSSSPGHQPLAEARISASALTAHRRSRKFSPRYCFPHPKRSGGHSLLLPPQVIFSLESSLVVFLLQEMELYCSYLLTIDLKKRKKEGILIPENDKQVSIAEAMTLPPFARIVSREGNDRPRL